MAWKFFGKQVAKNITVEKIDKKLENPKKDLKYITIPNFVWKTFTNEQKEKILSNERKEVERDHSLFFWAMFVLVIYFFVCV